MNEALNLYRLQLLDTQIGQHRTRLEEIEQALSNDQAVVVAQKALTAAESTLKSAHKNLRQIEDRVESHRLKRKESQAALFGGKVKNPKALQDLQMESESLKQYIGRLEDEQLEAMIAHETAQVSADRAQKALNNARAAAIEKNAALNGEKTHLTDTVDKLSRERDVVLQSITPDLLRLYKQLQKTKRGIAITNVSEGGCSICGQALTPADQQAIRTTSELIFCPSCGRILFAD